MEISKREATAWISLKVVVVAFVVCFPPERHPPLSDGEAGWIPTKIEGCACYMPAVRHSTACSVLGWSPTPVCDDQLRTACVDPGVDESDGR